MSKIIVNIAYFSLQTASSFMFYQAVVTPRLLVDHKSCVCHFIWAHFV